MPLNLTVVILTKNEELHIERCLTNLVNFAQRIVIVDSYSTDRTKEISSNYGVDFFENKFVNYANQFQWALDNCSISTDWILRLDADEILEEDLKSALNIAIPTMPSSVVGINLKRKHIFWGRWIRFGGRYPLVLLRIWRNGHGRIEQRWMDEHILVWGGDTVTVEGGFADINLNDLTFFTEKHNKYATREAIDILIQKYQLRERDVALSASSSSFQASIKRYVKEGVYNKMPFTVSASLYFVWRYFFQLGFIDGVPGFVYHFLQGYWYRFLVGAKVKEFERSFEKNSSKQEKIDVLRKLSGHSI